MLDILLALQTHATTHFELDYGQSRSAAAGSSQVDPTRLSTAAWIALQHSAAEYGTYKSVD